MSGEREEVDQELLDEMDDLDPQGGEEEIVEEVEEVAEEVEDEVEVEEESVSEDVEEDAGGESEEVEELDELTLLKNQNEALLARLNEVDGQTSFGVADAAEEVVEEAPAEVSFLTDDDDVDEILATPKNLNDFAMKIYSKAVADGEQKARESTMRGLPSMVLNNVKQQLYLERTVEKFFNDNKSLAVARKTVGAISNQVAAENPDWTLPKVLEETGKRSYRVLGLKKQVIKEGGDRNPALAGGSRGSRVGNSDRRSGLQKEIDDL